VLFALSLFLFTYPGYQWVDRFVGCVGGVAALFVALFPTTAPKGLCPPTLVKLCVKKGALCGSGLSLRIVHPFCCLAVSQIKCP
jgi:hypothetical protein